VKAELTLSDEDRAMLDGVHGEGTRTAMRIVTRIARIQGAAALVDVSHVHVGGGIYTGPGSLKVIETLVERGARVRVPTTINAISIDRQRWRTQNVDADFADKADRLATGFENLGASPIFSCTPYVFPDAPRYGQDIVWAESNAIVYANSVIGARTNRHGDFLDVCAAITGRAPLAGFHLPQNRTGTFLVNVAPTAQRDGFVLHRAGIPGRQERRRPRPGDRRHHRCPVHRRPQGLLRGSRDVRTRGHVPHGRSDTRGAHPASRARRPGAGPDP
jgi:cis-L-3-hydroxyproline dehydratase